ncbi:type II secretion system protein GspM [Labrenzia sp. OB1]|uniref:type II secretion system protein GspM n=1 Tax=Labrenzia sp. OB1 TaxID=1561204 RepID=UPI0007B2C393|nr:type II secretion system protein GspM [Labrenzia sp. OB1]KZM47464.1 hypothetical protein OA90_25685 [Labrenzia sp. OB1]
MSWLTKLSARDRRIAALALLAVIVWVAYAFVLSPLVTAQATLTNDIDIARKQLGRLEAVIARTRGTGGTEGAAPAPNASWHGTSPSVIAANVQSLVQSLASSNGVTIVSISQTQSRFAEGIETAGLVIEGYGEIAAFVGLLTALERNQPMLFVDNLMLRRYQAPSGGGAASRLPMAARFEVHAPHQLESAG